MRLFKRQPRDRPIPSVDASTISAKDARKLARSSSATGYNVFESIRKKANAGGMSLYVNTVKITEADINNLKSLGFTVRSVKDQIGKVVHFSIEW